MIDSDSTRNSLLKIEAWAALIYFAGYLVYLCQTLEGEAGHWISMILLPVGFILIHRIIRKQPNPITTTFASIGLRWGNLRTGLLWAFILGLALSVFQAYFSSRRETVWELFASGEALYRAPLVFILLLLTVGCTEECLFRGILQTRLTALLHSKLLGVLVASIFFGLYHVPYAYFHERWPTHGDLPTAFMSAMGQGIVGGLILGSLYAWTKRNLLACSVLHALIDVLPGMTVINISFSGE